MAHGPAATATSTDNITEDEQNLSSEQQIQRERDQTLAAELPEGSMFLTLLTSVSALAYGPLKKRTDLINAFKTVNDPHFEHELLKVRDPAKFQKLSKQYDLVKKEVVKQRKKFGDKRGYAQAGSGPFKRFKETINFDNFDHKEQAHKLATAVHNKINTADIKGKIAKTAEIYGFKDPKNITKLTRGLALWQKKNPGVHIDNYFQSFGQKLQYSQQPSKDGFFKRRKKEKETADNLYNEFDKVRVEAIKTNSSQIIAAQREVKELLDPSKPVVSQEELKARIDRTLHPTQTYATPTPPTYQPSFTPTHTTVTTPGPITPKPPIQPPPSSIPPATTKLATPIRRFQPQILKNFGEKFFGGKLAGLSTGGLISKGLTFAAGKLGLSAVAATLTAGSSALIQIGLEAAKRLPIIGDLVKSLEKVAFDTVKMAIFAVGVPVVLLILMLFSSSSSTLFPIGAGNAYPANQSSKINDVQNQNYSWKNFEKKYLSVVPKREENWIQFEEKNLLMENELLSLEKIRD